jgi:hypothetical protein
VTVILYQKRPFTHAIYPSPLNLADPDWYYKVTIEGNDSLEKQFWFKEKTGKFRSCYGKIITDRDTILSADCERFQGAIFGRTLVTAINVRKIKSGRGNESETGLLRVWVNNSGSASRSFNDHSLDFKSLVDRSHLEIPCKICNLTWTWNK